MTSQEQQHTQCSARKALDITQLSLHCCLNVTHAAPICNTKRHCDPYNSRALLCRAARCGPGSYAAARQSPKAQHLHDLLYCSDGRLNALCNGCQGVALEVASNLQAAAGRYNALYMPYCSAELLSKPSAAWSAVHKALAAVRP